MRETTGWGLSIQPFTTKTRASTAPNLSRLGHDPSGFYPNLRCALAIPCQRPPVAGGYHAYGFGSHITLAGRRASSRVPSNWTLLTSSPLSRCAWILRKSPRRQTFQADHHGAPEDTLPPDQQNDGQNDNIVSKNTDSTNKSTHLATPYTNQYMYRTAYQQYREGPPIE